MKDALFDVLIYELNNFAELFGEKAGEAAEASQKQDEKGNYELSSALRARAMAFLDAQKAIKEEIRRISN